MHLQQGITAGLRAGAAVETLSLVCNKRAGAVVLGKYQLRQSLGA
jgi:hypothetical protein